MADTRRGQLHHVTSLDDVISDTRAKTEKYSSLRTSIRFHLEYNTTPLSMIFALFEDEGVPVLEVDKSSETHQVTINVELEKLETILTKLKLFPGISQITKENTKENGIWFPKCLADLDGCAKNVLMYGAELDADHPGFKDEVYRKRRDYFTKLAMDFRHGDKIPRVEYTKIEIETWGKVYKELMELHPTRACAQHLKNLPLLSEFCKCSEDNVPQLEDISAFLQSRTGFRIRPAAGFLSPRDFLAGLAFRVFNCTQYIRHHSDPYYTPEPDICHEILGHVPLLADPEFAQFSQEIGLASLGVSDQDISKLAGCYLYTVEFGLCKEQDGIKAYGAGLLSSISELKHALSSPEKVRAFDAVTASCQESHVTAFQPVYFLSPSFSQAKHEMRAFAATLERPFVLSFDEETSSVKVFDKLSSIQSAVSKMSHDLVVISKALGEMEKRKIEVC
uniref:phenylalanine 4-monooxygenase n=1 Tax=Ciona intestinalis TaxID=7719 RepID=F6UB18_CIOIN